MALFDPPKAGDYPRKWKDMSLEFKLGFVYHGCMMFLFVAGGAFSVWQEVSLTIVILAVLASLSVRHRRSAGWRWQGAKPQNWLMAIGVVVLTGVFLYAATPMFPPSNPRFLPWYLAGLGIGMFNILDVLRLANLSEAAFLANCHKPGSQVVQTTNAEPAELHWRRLARAIITVLFFVVWLGAIASFYYSGAAFREGSSVPTATRADPLTDHGITVYIAHSQKILCDRLEWFAFIGIPLVFLAGLSLHFLVGVKLFPNIPTLSELLARKPSAD
jgi:hypothetical protein